MKMTDVQGSPGGIPPQADMVSSHEQLALLCADLKQQNAKLSARVRELEDEICRDTLTPLFNRRYFEQAVASAIAHCQRYQSRAALVFVDVDDLKVINDTFGHAAGDEALRCVAHVLLDNVRSTDVVARIGGDEFALILGAISEGDVEIKVAQLTAGIAACRIGFGEAVTSLSATFGHAFIHPDDEAGHVLARADSHMYRSKRSRGSAR
ncbi:GGDEF domain-containing protein [Blastomonas sp. SL216]|uniref:GGDEF domain-containing protein n=1 Tax=Blastomonas sp. SL216 TaxID=2995169 RepID=UPI0023771429|nr:GGDEF domain-containing protein [Blastomonas sp. SL216]